MRKTADLLKEMSQNYIRGRFESSEVRMELCVDSDENYFERDNTLNTKIL
jgi:hypothetical protein